MSQQPLEPTEAIVTRYNPNAGAYSFKGGYPTRDTVEAAYDDADVNRAIQAYRFFYPCVSALALFKGNAKLGLVENHTFGTLECRPIHLGFTSNSDTPYGPALLDLRGGPVVVELPPGPLICIVLDLNQRWVADMGLPGPDAGKGGKHLLLGPSHTTNLLEGYHVSRSTTNRVILGVRALPLGGDVEAALQRIRAVKIRTLHPTPGWTEPEWRDLTPEPQDTTPLAWENELAYWEALHELVNTEPPYEPYRAYYGELAALGIVMGKPFALDARMRRILLQAARIGNAQMRVQSFADRRPDRVVWHDRRWEWVGLRFENGAFDAPTYTDLDARETWFYQALGASPAMFRREVGAGSVYWLSTRDENDAFLDGAKNYRLSVPQPVPASLFWSVTVYDAQTRSQVRTAQGKAALRSSFELKGGGSAPIELHFGPRAPAGKEGPWIQTEPGKGWFAYFRVYGPERAAFDGSWKPSDFTALAT